MFILFGQSGLANRKKKKKKLAVVSVSSPPASAHPSDGNLAGLFMHSAPFQRIPFKKSILHPNPGI